MEYFDTDQITAISVATEDYYSRYTGEQIDNILYNSSAHIGDSTKHVTASERSTWNSKQSAISDLSTIRNGAALGSTAVRPSALNAHTDNTDIHVTEAQKSTWNSKQNAISDLATIRSNASNGATAYGWGNHANAGYYVGTATTIQNIKVNYAGSADKLKTPRNLWGQLFDGSADVSGNITVASIMATGNVHCTGTYNFFGKDGGVYFETAEDYAILAFHNNFTWTETLATFFANGDTLFYHPVSIGSGETNKSFFGLGNIEMYSPSPYIDFHINSTGTDHDVRLMARDESGINTLDILADQVWVRKNNYANDGASIRIGNALLTFDSAKNALVLTNVDGSSINFITSGDLIALDNQ